MHEDEGRRRHYGHFYGLEDLPEGDLLLVWGNCQGESYRRLLGGEPGTPLHGADLVSVRVPPAFEVQPDEVEHLERLLPRVKALVTQPIPHDYRGMPIGTDQLVARLPKDGTVIPFVSDYFDFSVYLDADENDLHRWYVNRFMTLRQTAFRDPRSFFRKYAEIGEEEALAIAEKLWTGINLPNLQDNILPTRQRASLILTKGASHRIQQVALRRL